MPIPPDELCRLLVREGIVTRPDLDADEPLISSGLITSLDVVRIIGLLEETWHVAIVDDDLRPDNFDSCRRMSAMLARYVDATGPTT
jgi:acyl carrier protein